MKFKRNEDTSNYANVDKNSLELFGSIIVWKVNNKKRKTISLLLHR